MSQYRKLITFTLGLLLLNIGLFTYLLHIGPPLPFHREGTQVGVAVKPLTVTKDTAVYIQDGYKTCFDAHLFCSEPVMLKGSQRDMLNGLGLNELYSIYPREENWKIEADSLGSSIMISRLLEGLCPFHNSFYHFAEKDGKLVAFYGPAAVGSAAGVVLETDILLDSLPEEIAQKIRLGQWEFKSWDELQSVIDALDEV